MGIQEERRGSRDPQARLATRSSLVPLNEDEGGGGGAMDRISKRRSSRAMPGSRQVLTKLETHFHYPNVFTRVKPLIGLDGHQMTYTVKTFHYL